ncbi:Two-component response regulator-like PRR37 [Citrus sinensis]|uniref:Two-component response regulator-like PRR37 n=1 Tax=Citrus sinensis TaxID=2711 RepID=A0ACB8IVI1_CITSI|nr:Two-component response regulator-like PRR37 [Citrus sinensis]
MCYEQKEVGNGVAGEGHGLGSSEEDESRVDDAVNSNNGPGETIQVHDGFQISQQQQPQGSVIRWERFLPTRSLKVLLVENDDSTRHVVSALLRNCSYEVTAVANSLHAWKILEDLTNHIDIVLTEVDMPVVSGIGLLCKIMTHKTLKNIPVIMMSPKDSMGIVFKCLSKGAVDFLVKPIRKNELKNLWQHVWRRCHSSSGSGSGSGSGSESGTQTKKSAKSKSNNGFENDSSSSDELENGSNGLSIRDGSDNGSGTQSSWTKKAAEVDSPQPISPRYQSADDSICAQVIHTKPESFSNGWVHLNEPKDGLEQDEQPDGIAMHKGLEMQVSENADLKCDCQHEKKSTQQTSKKKIKLPEVDSKPFDNKQLEVDNENICGKRRDQATSTSSANANHANPHAEIRDFDTPSGPSDISHVKETPCLELTLKRMRGVEDDQSAANEDCNVLRHSNFSAFSKILKLLAQLSYVVAFTYAYIYATIKMLMALCQVTTNLGQKDTDESRGLTGNVGSCSPLDNSSVAMKTETMQNFPSHSNGTPLNRQSNGSSNNNDMASTAKYVTLKPEALNDKSESISAFKPFHSSAFQALQNSRSCSSQQVLPEKTDDMGPNSCQSQLRGSHHSVQAENHHHHHHHHHHYHQHGHSMHLHQSPQDHDDLSSKAMAAAAPQCGSSNVFETNNDGDVGNYDVNGRICSSQPLLPEKTDDMGLNSGQSQLRGSHHSVQVENHHHHYHRHYHQHDHNMQQSPQDCDDVSFKNMVAAAPQCGSSNVFESTNEGNAGNYSVNGSASGSNHGSNGQNGSSTALNAGVTNLDSDNGAAGNSGVGGITERISGNVVDEVWVAQREAALTKFRQKRKERCFGKRVTFFLCLCFCLAAKDGLHRDSVLLGSFTCHGKFKVRYQSRKKLAEQRPRVRGQFVRQLPSDANSGKDTASNGHTSEDYSSDNLR